MDGILSEVYGRQKEMASFNDEGRRGFLSVRDLGRAAAHPRRRPAQRLSLRPVSVSRRAVEFGAGHSSVKDVEAAAATSVARERRAEEAVAAVLRARHAV
jgi:hypothetical protein